jgi:hypothetical protein
VSSLSHHHKSSLHLNQSRDHHHKHPKPTATTTVHFTIHHILFPLSSSLPFFPISPILSAINTQAIKISIHNSQARIQSSCPHPFLFSSQHHHHHRAASSSTGLLLSPSTTQDRDALQLRKEKKMKDGESRERIGED